MLGVLTVEESSNGMITPPSGEWFIQSRNACGPSSSSSPKWAVTSAIEMTPMMGPTVQRIVPIGVCRLLQFRPVLLSNWTARYLMSP